jgi:hypothetical protein
MKIYTASEKEISQKFNSQWFCKVFKTLEEAPEGFYDLQDKIRDGLEKEFWVSFPEGEDRSPRPSWQSPSHNWFCFNTDMFGSEHITIEMTKEILEDKLIGIVLSYLEKCPSRYCVILDVYDNMMKGSEYIGSVIMNLKEIAIEETVAEVWSKQIKFMEIEERK